MTALKSGTICRLCEPLQRRMHIADTPVVADVCVVSSCHRM